MAKKFSKSKVNYKKHERKLMNRTARHENHSMRGSIWNCDVNIKDVPRHPIPEWLLDLIDKENHD